MKNAYFCITILLHLVLVFTSNDTSILLQGNRKKRVFSLFSVVNFPNTQCTLLSTANSGLVMFGVCFSPDDCRQTGGAVDGNCAAGFGVCCMISVSNCGSSISKNITYIQNPGFPGSYSPGGQCIYTFNADPSICQIRLEFDIFIIGNPNTGLVLPIGQCAVDSFVPLSPTGYSPPTICGTNSGTHMYIETGQTTSQAAQITFNLLPLPTPTTTRRSWKIRVYFVECFSEYRAPSDCVQYFTGTAGTFQSYNYLNPGGQVIQNQNYHYCFRQEEGYCGMDISVPQKQVFNLNRVNNLAGKSKRSAGGCANIHLEVRTNVVTDPASNTDYFCGWYLNDLVGHVVNGIVRANSFPLAVGFFSNNLLSPMPPGPGATTSEDSIGFLADFMQVPC